MSSYEWEEMMKKDTPMTESDFDILLEDCVPELPPMDVVRAVTPWKKAMNRVLWGMALTTITLEFWGLDYILSTVGMFLSLLGYRMLREENNWFKACWRLMLVRMVWFWFSLMLDATVFHSAFEASTIGMVMTCIMFAVIFGQIFCLWKGIRKTQEKAGVPQRAKSAIVLMVWYGIMCFLGVIQYSGFIIPWAMIIGYICIVRSLYKLSKELSEAGYTIETTSIHTSDKKLVVSLLMVLAIGISCGYLFFYSYPMDWQPAVASEDKEVEEIKAHLIELGFPEAVLEDLSEADIKECKGALRVVIDEVREYPVNNGREVVETSAGTTHIYTVYDAKELRFTEIGVELPGERERWKIIHHFQFTTNPGFRGTECIQLWPCYGSRADHWASDSETTGQVLYDKEGQTYVAPYVSLEEENYQSNSILFGDGTVTDVFAEFSMPKDGKNHRGYMSYTIKEMQDGQIVYAGINYTHQNGWFQYPVMTAKEKRMKQPWDFSGVFKTAQDVIQFNPNASE